MIQVVLISESVRLQQLLATYGIATQTPTQVEPVQIWPPSELVNAYERLGVNDKLRLSGRPARPIGGLGTAKVKCLTYRWPLNPENDAVWAIVSWLTKITVNKRLL